MNRGETWAGLAADKTGKESSMGRDTHQATPYDFETNLQGANMSPRQFRAMKSSNVRPKPPTAEISLHSFVLMPGVWATLTLDTDPRTRFLLPADPQPKDLWLNLPLL